MPSRNGRPSLSFEAFRETYHYRGDEGSLRLTARRTRAYDFSRGTYNANPNFLATLFRERRIPEPSDGSLDALTRTSHMEGDELIPLANLLHLTLQACAPACESEQLPPPCRGDIEAYLVSTHRPRSTLARKYPSGCIESFLEYWIEEKKSDRLKSYGD